MQINGFAKEEQTTDGQGHNMALKGTRRLMAVLKFCNLSSLWASFTVRERHAP